MLPVYLNEYYLLYPDGRLLSLRHNRWRKASVTKAGYLTYGSLIGSVHRLLAHCFKGGIPKGLVVNHKDGVKLNNDLDNLEITTHSENTKHAYDTGLAKGLTLSKNSMAKLRLEEMHEVMRMLKSGLSNMEISEKFGLHDRYVSLIRHGKRWKEIYPLYGPFTNSKPEDHGADKYNVFLNLEPLYTNKEISKILGVDASTVSRWRSRKSRG